MIFPKSGLIGKINFEYPIALLPGEVRGGRHLILIAEDEDANYRLMEIFLKSSYDILRAENGLEAVNISRSTPGLSLILMDIKMPVMDGYEAIRQIRQFNNHICIIAQSAYGLLGDRELALEAGCNDYIVKPVGKERLLALVENYCQMHQKSPAIK